jgi:PIN domain nuclease of toxin-antitoxin system
MVLPAPVDLMAFLPDAHALLLCLAEPERLSPVVHATLADPALPVFISAASAWEIVTKHRLGLLPLPKPVVIQARLLQLLGFADALHLVRSEGCGALILL